MFEKEAEEYVPNINWHTYSSKEIREAMLSFCRKSAEFGYNKANEWHFVKDGDLPKHEVNVLVLFNKQCVDIAHYNYDYKEWHFADSIVYDVIAWKEIVLPEESDR